MKIIFGVCKRIKIYVNAHCVKSQQLIAVKFLYRRMLGFKLIKTKPFGTNMTALIILITFIWYYKVGNYVAFCLKWAFFIT